MTREVYLFLYGAAGGAIYGAFVGAFCVFAAFWFAQRRAAGLHAISAIRHECRHAPVNVMITFLLVMFVIACPLWMLWKILSL